MTTPKQRMLDYLTANPGATVLDLADDLHLDKQSVHRYLVRLYKAGYAVRQRQPPAHPGNRQAPFTYTLTALGEDYTRERIA
jgi:DNA-binding MarR family transcriptional regulator